MIKYKQKFVKKKRGINMVYTYNKLVRDKIPEEINSMEGRKAKFRIMDENEYIKELNRKLLEESNEFVEENDIEELADVMEVMESIMKIKNIQWEEVKKIQTKKRDKKGSFDRKIYLEYVEEEKRNIKEEEDLKKSIRK